MTDEKNVAPNLYQAYLRQQDTITRMAALMQRARDLLIEAGEDFDVEYNRSSGEPNKFSIVAAEIERIISETRA